MCVCGGGSGGDGGPVGVLGCGGEGVACKAVESSTTMILIGCLMQVGVVFGLG